MSKMYSLIFATAIFLNLLPIAHADHQNEIISDSSTNTEVGDAIEAWEFCDSGIYQQGKRRLREVLRTERAKHPGAKVAGSLLRAKNIQVLEKAPYRFKAELGYYVSFTNPEGSNEFSGGYWKEFSVDMTAHWPLTPMPHDLCEVDIQIKK